MFKIATNPEFTHNVPVMVPVDGGHSEETLSVTFRQVPMADVEAYDLNTGSDTVSFLQTVIVSVNDVVGDDDKPLPYNDALRDRLLDLSNIRVAMVNAYLHAVMKARVGN